MHDWLISNKEIINMSIQLLIAFIGGGAIIALIFHRKSIMLQRQATQASMFSDINGRISVLLEETPILDDNDINSKDDKKDGDQETAIYNWYIRLFNEFESIIFLARNNYLSIAMEKYYRSWIIEWVDDFCEEFPGIAKDFSMLPKTSFSNLRWYYKHLCDKEIFF